MPASPEDLCPEPVSLPSNRRVEPLSAPLYLSSVYRCQTTQEAAALLAGDADGYVYRRDGHPNADLLAEKCRKLHGAERAAITASGMAAMAAVLLSQLQHGDHVLVSNRLYGASLELLTTEAERYGVESSAIDTNDLAAVEAAFRPKTRLLVVETIANPTLRVADIAALADLTHRAGARLLVDNTFASAALCRPADLGADLVLESLTKIGNGHSDVVLGLLCGTGAVWERVPRVLSRWGLASSPFDCWLAARGLETLALRAKAACENAMAAARFLAGRSEVLATMYPGLPDHPDHALAARQFGEQFGSIVTFTLRGGLPSAEAFIAGVADRIPFCPSLGEVTTTLSHPASTSHRSLTEAARSALGIEAGTIRLSLGIESNSSILAALAAGLKA